MGKNSELIEYLKQEKDKINFEFPKNEKITDSLFEKLYDFLENDFEGMSDNRVYRCFLTSFKEMICFAFRENVSKAYLRCFFKSLNREDFVSYLAKHAKSREKDIRFIMKRFLNSFIYSWQGYDNDKNKVLNEIVVFIDCWM
ncbi:MAG: hypothetical protein IKB86_03520 [Clostridia bacterium]|nr:hypothetical protein [Clostridia bacterium]